MTSAELINRLQPFMRKSMVYEEIFKADAKQLETRNRRIKDLMLQFNVDTATWGLVFFENDYGIPIDESKSYADRRALIKSKMRGTGTVTASMMKDVALAFTGGQIDISFDGKIRIAFTDVIGTPPNLVDFKNAIDEIKPAFLDVVYIFLYNQYYELTGYTYGYLGQYTHAQLRSSEIN